MNRIHGRCQATHQRRYDEAEKATARWSLTRRSVEVKSAKSRAAQFATVLSPTATSSGTTIVQREGADFILHRSVLLSSKILHIALTGASVNTGSRHRDVKLIPLNVAFIASTPQLIQVLN